MAKRRALARALAGLGEGVANASNLYLRHRQQQDLQDRYDKRAEESAKASFARTEFSANRQAVREVQNKVATGELDPSAGAVMIANILGEEPNPQQLEPVRPSLTKRLGKQFGGMMDAPFPEGLPTDEEIATFASDPAEGGLMPSPGAEFLIDTPMSGGPLKDFRPEVRDFSNAVGVRRRALQGRPTERVESVDPTTGAPRVQMFSPSALAGGVETGPSATQKGVLAGQQEVAEQTTTLGDAAFQRLRGETEARMQNLVSALTRQAKVADVAAETGARKRAELAPDIVEAEVNRATALAAGKDQSTESERRAATNWAPLVNAHALASEMEAHGASIGLLDPTLSKWPIANRAVSEQSQQYMQAARDFISTLGLIRSGVTVRPDEAESLFATMFRVEGEGPEQLRNKQRSREVFLASMQAMVGRSGDEAGRILAEAINRRQISPSVLQSLQFENPQLKDALLKNLRGVPIFDLSGKPIGVRQ